jgi:hypothetical protein
LTQNWGQFLRGVFAAFIPPTSIKRYLLGLQQYAPRDQNLGVTACRDFSVIAVN